MELGFKNFEQVFLLKLIFIKILDNDMNAEQFILGERLMFFYVCFYAWNTSSTPWAAKISPRCGKLLAWGNYTWNKIYTYYYCLRYDSIFLTYQVTNQSVEIEQIPM